MSIYGTLWEMRFPIDGGSGFAHPNDDRFAIPITEEAGRMFVDVCAQCVPGHIDYTGPAWEWLPPIVDEGEEAMRAVFIVCDGITTKGSERCGQEYVNPLLVLTGRQYQQIPWQELWDRIAEAVAEHTKAGREPTITRLPL